MSINPISQVFNSPDLPHRIGSYLQGEDVLNFGETSKAVAKDLESSKNEARNKLKLLQKIFRENLNKTIYSFPDIQVEVGNTGYINAMPPQELSAPIMRYTDKWGREGVAIRVRDKITGARSTLAFFERYKDRSEPIALSYSPDSYNSDGSTCFKSYGRLLKRDLDFPQYLERLLQGNHQLVEIDYPIKKSRFKKVLIMTTVISVLSALSALILANYFKPAA